MSELATELNGFSRGGADRVFSELPDTQLNTWSEDQGRNAEHYGASYLFTSYFLDRFGEDLTKAVVASDANGVDGFTEALSQAGTSLTFDDVFADWLIANYLDDPNLDDGRYGYVRDDPEQVALDERFDSYPVPVRTSTVHQYAADYVELAGEGDVVIEFAGSTLTHLADTQAHSGRFAYWANRADDSDARLTRAVDLSDVQKATLQFWMWYDIEENWDYAYVEISTDQGETWTLLRGQHTTEENPTGNSFGPGYTGKSGGGEQAKWVQERIDLSPYAGGAVLLRFEYVTDDAVNLPGLFLDDIAIPEVGILDDLEHGGTEWQAEGWIRTDNVLPQRWLVQLIELTPDGPQVRRMALDDQQRGQLSVEGLGRNHKKAVLVISALAPVTTEVASYQYAIKRSGD
ncbi:MAG TPA: hypothetical protein EYP04_13300 [Anaerolineae bacterium]|nr:hypothetical protein [Anaerolineae bacterium]